MTELHTAAMPRKARKLPKWARRETFIRQWRKERDVTLEKLSDMLLTQLEVELSDGQLSRIERGESPYTQDTLEAIGLVLRVEPEDLISKDPAKRQEADEFRDMTPDEKRQARAFLTAIRGGKTGTEG